MKIERKKYHKSFFFRENITKVVSNNCLISLLLKCLFDGTMVYEFFATESYDTEINQLHYKKTHRDKKVNKVRISN